MGYGITSQWAEDIINRYLRLDPESQNKLAEFKGKILCVDVLGLNRQYYIFPEEDGLRIKSIDPVSVASASDETPISETVIPETTIRGTPTALLKLALQADAAPLMLTGEVEILGNVRLGRKFKKFISQLDIDWEEQASKIIGDVPANMAFNLFDKISSWAKQATGSVTGDISEYLQEESRDVVTGVELKRFYKKVDQLRNDVDRLEARLKLKTTKQKTKKSV